MKVTGVYNNQKGFTLVEIIAVLIILGILAAVAVPRYINLETNAKDRAIDAAVSELNGRENLTWANIKIGSPPPTAANVDSLIWAAMSTDLGGDYSWATTPVPVAGDDLTFQSAATAVTLARTAATLDTPGIWSR